MKKYGSKSIDLGCGAYGSINLYVNDEKDLKYAVKKMDYFDKDEDGINFVAIVETAIHKRMNHPNIVKFIDYVISDKKNKIYIVMEYMENNNLNEIIGGAYNQLYFKGIVYQILCGMAYMHSRDILHLDLKPENIFATRKGNFMYIKIGDFGFSRALYCASENERTGNVITMEYRPPELFYGGKIYYKGSDMWSVGCIIYKFLTRKTFVKGYTETEIINYITSILGTPTENNMPGITSYPKYKDTNIKPNLDKIKNKIYKKINKWFDYDDEYSEDAKEWYNIIISLLKYDPNKRASALDVLKRPFFDDVRDKKLESKYLSCLENLYEVEKPIIYGKKSNKYEKIDVFFKTYHKQFDIQVFYMTFYLIDLLYNKMNTFISSNTLLFYESCLYISQLYMVDRFISISKYKSKSTDLIKTVTNILNEIKFNLVFSTCYEFYNIYKKFYSKHVAKLAKSLMLFVVLLPDKFYRGKQSNIALMSIMMACMYYGKKFKHVKYLTYKMIKDVTFCQKKINTSNLPFLKKYFSEIHALDIDETLRKICGKKLFC